MRIEVDLGLVAPVQIQKKERMPPSRRPLTATWVSVFKFDDLSACCSCFPDVVRVQKLITRLKLSGCAVISKGFLVVEGKISAIERFSKLVRQKEASKPVSVVWQGKARRQSFGKFSIIRRCSSDFALCKFFANHGASDYWDLAVKSD